MAVTSSDVLLYFANIVGYSRVIALFGAYYYFHTNWVLGLGLYLYSFGMDMVDGTIARAFNQSSRFGAALDMMTDKMSTPGLFLALTYLYPSFKYFFLFTMFLDIISHYFHVTSTLLRGVKSHKIIDPSEPFLIRLFYGNKTFFTW
eukprot:TRINITY_DN5305_c0_g1_i2.p1 TRINITY_DN5305_c0_g1~~TRINITY_DN5305_c0_g1_i2.p1  ORF type:complete len:146 (-),score=27.36 TRINITY_DN5305_c0_g1_i2:78-515(-)